MAVTRINQFEAKASSEEMLYSFLKSMTSIIEASPGCISCKLLRSTDNPACLAIIEEWESVEAHQRAATAIPSEELAKAASMFAKSPTGMYYKA